MGPSEERITQAAARDSMSSDSPEPTLVTLILFAVMWRLHRLRYQLEGLGEMLLNRAIRHTHARSNFSLRQFIEFLQFECLSAFRRQAQQNLLQSLHFLLTAEAAMGIHFIINDVQRFQIRHQFDRDDPRAADILADDVARRDEQIAARILDALDIGRPQTGIGFLDNLIDVARRQAAYLVRQTFAHNALMRQHFAREPEQTGLVIHIMIATVKPVAVKRNVTIPSSKFHRSRYCE